MENNPFVDVIMPNYNKGKFLEESINSVISQEYEYWKLYIIDNFSTDESKKILKRYKNIKKDINLIFLSKNKGASFSRNLAIRLSNSKYISFLDSDDYWSKDKLKDQINFMEKNNYVFTYTDYIPFILKNDKKFFKKDIIAPNSFNFNRFIADTSISTSTMIIQRSIIKTTKFPKIKTLEDYAFKCQLLKNGNQAIKFNQSSSYYRILKNSLSSNKLKSLYWLWCINKKYNKLSFIYRLKSALLIIISSMKKYAFR